MEPIEGFDTFPLIDALDHDILMHRDAHFGGKFPIMLEYYQQGGKGVQSELTVERIEKLAELETKMQQNLAAVSLTGSEVEKIAASKEAYKQLRSLYEVKKTASRIPQLIADLIFSEEEEPEKEIDAIVAEKDRIVPALIDLLKNEDFHDPLFPGYGLAPSLAVKCLGRIGDKRAIISLFEAFGQDDFFTDDQIIKALQAIGEPAKSFLLRVVKGRPLNEDNERAAIALIEFRQDPDVAAACFDLLQNPDVQKDPCLATYLVLACEGLPPGALREDFIHLAKQAQLPKSIKTDMEAIMHTWNTSKSS